MEGLTGSSGSGGDLVLKEVLLVVGFPSTTNGWPARYVLQIRWPLTTVTHTHTHAKAVSILSYIAHFKHEAVVAVSAFESFGWFCRSSQGRRGELIPKISLHCISVRFHKGRIFYTPSRFSTLDLVKSKVPASEVEGLPPGQQRMTFKPPQLSDEEVITYIFSFSSIYFPITEENLFNMGFCKL